MEIIAITIAIYLLVGFWLVRKTESRGKRADASFVLLWGVHFIDEYFLRPRK